MGRRDRYAEESRVGLREIMTEPPPSPETRAQILARRRTARTMLEDRRDRLEIESLSFIC